MLELGHAYLFGQPLPAAARHLEPLARQLSASCWLGTLDGDSVVCRASGASKGILSTVLPVGTRLPAHATAAGWVLLANAGEAELQAYLRLPI